MDTKRFRGSGLIPGVLPELPLNHPFFKHFDGFFQEEARCHKPIDQSIQTFIRLQLQFLFPACGSVAAVILSMRFCQW